MTKAVQQYLSRYSEKEATNALELFSADTPPYTLGMTIPAFNEDISCVERCIAWAQQSQVKTLLVLVVNTPEECELKAANNTQKLIQSLESKFNTRAHHHHLQLLNCHPLLDILLVNRTSPNAIPNKQGVGLARKIGADILASLSEQELIDAPWICSTDADATLPLDYFQALQQTTPAGAAVFPFKHERQESPTGIATLLYEIALLYYVLGIRYSGFPYDWPTIGSTVAIHYECYCQIRGFPKRSGGEDFYLLNKASKITPTRYIQSSPIYIAPRLSDRVPFGTGPAVAKLISNHDDSLSALWQRFHYYDPRSFSVLKLLNQAIQRCASALEPLTLVNFNHSTSFTTDALLQELGELIQFTERTKRIIQQYKTSKKVLRQLYQEFDAFQLLKIVHWLRETNFPDQPLSDALAHSPFLDTPQNSTFNHWQQTISLANHLHNLVFPMPNHP